MLRYIRGFEAERRALEKRRFPPNVVIGRAANRRSTDDLTEKCNPHFRRLSSVCDWSLLRSSLSSRWSCRPDSPCALLLLAVSLDPLLGSSISVKMGSISSPAEAGAESKPRRTFRPALLTSLRLQWQGSHTSPARSSCQSSPLWAPNLSFPII